MSSEIRYGQECHCCGKVTNVDFYSDSPFCRYLCFDCKVGGGRRSSLVGGVTYFHNNEFVSCCKIPDETKCNDCYFTCLPYSKKFSNYPLGKVKVFFPKDNIPIDAKGLQCLPMSSPVHPAYALKHSVFNPLIKDHLPSIDEWRQWFDEQFIEIDDARIKREILRWYAKNTKQLTPEFISLYSKQNQRLNLKN